MRRIEVTSALIIKAEPLEKILSGDKIWEIRGRRTTVRGKIGLIQSGSGTVVGIASVIDVIGPLTESLLAENANRAGGRFASLPYPTTYAWVLADARRLEKPVRYKHPSGAVIWVRLPESVSRKLAK